MTTDAAVDWLDEIRAFWADMVAYHEAHWASREGAEAPAQPASDAQQSAPPGASVTAAQEQVPEMTSRGVGGE